MAGRPRRRARLARLNASKIDDIPTDLGHGFRIVIGPGRDGGRYPRPVPWSAVEQGWCNNEKGLRILAEMDYRSGKGYVFAQYTYDSLRDYSPGAKAQEKIVDATTIKTTGGEGPLLQAAKQLAAQLG